MTAARQKVWLIVIAVLIVLRFVVQPWLQWVNEKTASIEQLQFNIERLDVIDKRVAELGGIATELDTRFSALNSMLQPGDHNTASLAISQHLDMLAKKHSIAIQNKNTGKVQQADVRAMALNFFARGNPADIIRFMSEIEQVAPKIQLVNGTFALQNSRATQLNVNLSMLVFMQPEGVASAAD